MMAISAHFRKGPSGSRRINNLTPMIHIPKTLLAALCFSVACCPPCVGAEPARGESESGVVAPSWNEASGDLEMSCRHAFANTSDGTYLVLYVTLRNRGDKPLDVVTCLPSPLFLYDMGGMTVSLTGDWPSDKPNQGETLIRERLMPRTLAPNEFTTFAVQYQMAALSSFPRISEDTPVTCRYGVGEANSKRYGVWGGRMAAKSTLVPFYEGDGPSEAAATIP